MNVIRYVEHVKPADIIFTRDEGAVSWALRFLQGSFPYSHVCIAGIDGDIYTTGSGGFRNGFRYGIERCQDYLEKRSFEVCRYEGLDPRQQIAILDYCNAHIGQPYPFMDVASLIAKGLAGKGVCSVKKTDFIFKGNEFCAENVWNAFAHAGIILNPRAHNCDGSGADVREIYESPHLETVYKEER